MRRDPSGWPVNWIVGKGAARAIGDQACNVLLIPFGTPFARFTKASRMFHQIFICAFAFDPA